MERVDNRLGFGTKGEKDKPKTLIVNIKHNKTVKDPRMFVPNAKSMIYPEAGTTTEELRKRGKGLISGISGIEKRITWQYMMSIESGDFFCGFGSGCDELGYCEQNRGVEGFSEADVLGSLESSNAGRGCVAPTILYG
ncbi:hypothetical protein FQA39_LY14173 [Lamprigera yunnana]|nr:hypothetical protein FQA39_LY14173 [Lamprigera yunnana]